MSFKTVFLQHTQSKLPKVGGKNGEGGAWIWYSQTIHSWLKGKNKSSKFVLLKRDPVYGFIVKIPFQVLMEFQIPIPSTIETNRSRLYGANLEGFRRLSLGPIADTGKVPLWSCLILIRNCFIWTIFCLFFFFK